MQPEISRASKASDNDASLANVAPFAVRMRVMRPSRAATDADDDPPAMANITDTYLIPMDEWELILPPDAQLNNGSHIKKITPPGRRLRWRWRRVPGVMIKFELDESVPDDIIE